MSPSDTATEAERILAELRRFIDVAVEEAGTTEAIKPGHRIQFQWPLHPVSFDFRIPTSAFMEDATFASHGETFAVKLAHTEHGVFGRCDELWLEARGDGLHGMLKAMSKNAEPLFQRQFAISRVLKREGRFTASVASLPPADLVKLLYCPDRDVAHDASVQIETHASLHVFRPALVEVLRDKRHPQRRSAQWCVLDLFEDLPSYCETPEYQLEAVEAMLDMLYTAEDDYARTTFKAGVVLGGHLPYKYSGSVLIQCLDAPSKYGRRSAIHGLFHVVEWNPESRETVVHALRERAKVEPIPALRDFATSMANDLANSATDHILEPVFEDER